MPRNIRLAEAPSHGKAALVYDPRSKGAESYIRLAKEIIERQASCQLSALSYSAEPEAPVADQALGAEAPAVEEMPAAADGDGQDGVAN